jgi:bifunctional DNA-binding transcriptional regulator/antitoxin component of YhaV-PrlF toxin-antitoxin module
MMPRLQKFSKTKRESYGIQRHDSYNVIIPHEITEELKIQDRDTLYATANTTTLRLHKNPLKDCIAVKTRQRLTKIYKNEKYYSTRVTIPIKIIKLLNLAKNDNLCITCNKDTVIIKRHKKQ